VLEARMIKARDWLVEERLSIKAVAEMTGYDDISYFHRVFKKHFGVAPGEMRKKDEV
jgi:two-component system response regulator YesN